MAEVSGESSGGSNTLRDDAWNVPLHSKHKIFLSHSGAQKDFAEQLCVDLERCDRYPFFDKRSDSLPIGDNFPRHMFDVIKQCQVGVVILSEEFFTRSKWPMIELVEMVKEVKRRELSFKIMPVFLRISLDQFHDRTKWNRWLSCWHELAFKDRRVNVEEWEDALKYLHPINSMVYDGLGEVKFRKRIVDEICKVVSPQTRLEDSHIQGRSRLCKVIQEKIYEQENGNNCEVRVVGLYGVGGIGKTSICKALCNEYVPKYHGRVCHAELGRRSKAELMREVLKRLTDTSHELFDRWNEDELLKGLNGGIIREPVFLAVDNVSDTQDSIDEAKQYVTASLPSGSIVMLTSRSKGTLMRVRRDMVERDVLEMPELNVEEAKSLFCRSSELELRSEADDRVIMRCVERCRFRKDDGSDSHHYHPLTLDVLGKQLGCIDRKEWEAHLNKIDKDIFNQSGESDHPIFSILRKSYDVLTPKDQLLLMDVALFLPDRYYFIPDSCSLISYQLDMFEWLGMVCRTSVDDVVSGLERLRRKSLLETLGDGREMRIGMHDLWRAFCEAEAQSGELKFRRWVYEVESCRELIETSPSGGCWENVKRMSFFGDDLKSLLERMNFSHFPNVTVLSILRLDLTKELVLDFSRLTHLKSLELTGHELHNLVLHGLPPCLGFIRVVSNRPTSRFSHQFIKQVEHLTELKHLELIRYSGDNLPDMKRMLSIRVALFYGCQNVVTVTGLSTKLSNLRVLHFGYCSQLRSCPGVGDLVALEDLNFRKCSKLKRLPNLRKLRTLKKLDVSGCPLINEVPGLGDLVSLGDLHGGSDYYNIDEASYSLTLPDMSKLKNLRVLRLPECRLKAVPGFESLISLVEVETDFREVADRPSLEQLTKLQTLKISGWGLEGLDHLAMLRSLEISDCSGVDRLPDLQGLIRLQELRIKFCEFKDVSCLSNLMLLESLHIAECKLLDRLPDLQRLTRLK